MGNFSKYKKYFIVFFGLIVSYYISIFFIKNIFLANSPKIRPNLGSYYLAKIKNSLNKVSGFIALKNIKTNLNLTRNNKTSTVQKSLPVASSRDLIMEELSKSLKPITKGVSAASKDGYNYYEFKVNEIEWVMIEYTLKNGEIIKIRYPKGTNPPPKEIYEQ